MKTIFDAIKEQVTIFDVCDLAGVHYHTKVDGHKVFCPFHDDTTTKSGYIYPDTNTFRCFVCARNWDVIDFWAQHNEWWKPHKKTGEPTLDVGKAIADLKTRFGIEVVQPTWEQKFFALRGEETTPQGYAGFPLAERVKMRDYYAWTTQLRLREVDKARRAETVDRALALWDQLDAVDLDTDSWKSDLNRWLDCARLLA